MTAPHAATLEQWLDAVGKAVRDRALDAVPVILVRMARDGYATEADSLRKQLAAASTRPRPGTVGPGHDQEAAEQVRTLTLAYRIGGVDALRKVARMAVRVASPDAAALLLAEAVLTLVEHDDARARRAQADFDRAEAADEAFRERER